MVEYWATYGIPKDERWPRVCFEQYHEFLVENKLRNTRKHNNSRPVFLLDLKMEETSPRRTENNRTSGEEIRKKVTVRYAMLSSLTRLQSTLNICRRSWNGRGGLLRASLFNI